MPGARIHRPQAVEERFVVDAAATADILSWARAELTADPHGGGPNADAYRVTTHYLDTPALDTFRRRSSFGRAKFRLRRYGEGQVVFAERKLRTASALAKWRTAVPLDGVSDLLDTGRNGHGAAWFAQRVALRRLRPVCVIAYNRVARQLSDGSRMARLTVDSLISATSAASFPLPGGSETPLLSEYSIVEFKYEGFPPAPFKTLVERLMIMPRRISKYRCAVVELGLAPPEFSSVERHS
jgi:hypothetical protein